MNTPRLETEQLTKKDILGTEYEKRMDLKARYILEEIDRLKGILKDSDYEYNFDEIFKPKTMKYIDDVANNMVSKVGLHFAENCTDSVEVYHQALEIMKKQIHGTEKVKSSREYGSVTLKETLTSILDRKVSNNNFLSAITPDRWIKKKKEV